MSTRQKFNEDSYVNCPYYRKESPVEIRCEGMCGITTTHYFESRSMKDDFKDELERKIAEGAIDLVFTVNYFPVVAEV